MRKLSSVLSVLIIIITVAFIAVPRPAAAFVPVAEPKVWEWYGEGVTGEVIPMDTITTKPQEWYQLKSDGLKLDAASGICYPFDEGRFGWTGEIFQLVEGAWIKLATTVGWVPTEEGKFLACAQAPAAGTYALFAYYDPAKAPVLVCEYDMSDWFINLESYLGLHFYAHTPSLPDGTLVTYQLISMQPDGSITGAMSGEGNVGNYVDGEVDFFGYIITVDPGTEIVMLRISALGCTKYLSLNIGED
jgi:hypothetical protein